MTDLVRKIKSSRWYIDEASPLPADPLVDLRTSGNSLSLWAVEPQNANLQDVVVAIAAPSDNLSKIDVAFVTEASISNLGLTIQETPGRTHLEDAREYHRDVIDLTANDLVSIAEAIRSDKRQKAFPLPQVRKLLAEAINNKRIRREDLNPRVIKDLEKHGLI